jgi:hypothetical protein
MENDDEDPSKQLVDLTLPVFPFLLVLSLYLHHHYV